MTASLSPAEKQALAFQAVAKVFYGPLDDCQPIYEQLLIQLDLLKREGIDIERLVRGDK